MEREGTTRTCNAGFPYVLYYHSYLMSAPHERVRGPSDQLHHENGRWGHLEERSELGSVGIEVGKGRSRITLIQSPTYPSDIALDACRVRDSIESDCTNPTQKTTQTSLARV